MNDIADIEIYVANMSASMAVEWLTQVLDQATPAPKKKGMPKNATLLNALWQQHRFSIMIMEDAVKGYTSLWFDSAILPWPNDTECAKQAAAYFNKGVRVTAGGWEDNADPDAWIDVSPRGELTTIIWKT